MMGVSSFNIFNGDEIVGSTSLVQDNNYLMCADINLKYDKEIKESEQFYKAISTKWSGGLFDAPVKK